MKKKHIALAVIAVLVIVTIGIGVAVLRSNNSSSSDASKQNSDDKQLLLKFSDLQANYPANPEACLATGDDPALRLDTVDQTRIVDAVVGAIIDIPAGTNTDVHIKTYDKKNATGTSIYESTYGSYNFTAKKTSNNASQSGWIVTNFVACKK